MTDDVVIQVNNVSKKFKSQVVLKDITLQCRKGRIYGGCIESIYDALTGFTYPDEKDLGKQFFLNVYVGYFM